MMSNVCYNWVKIFQCLPTKKDNVVMEFIKIIEGNTTSLTLTPNSISVIELFL